MLPDQQELNRLLRYDPTTGLLFWNWQAHSTFMSERLAKIWNKKYADKEALTAITTGYRAGRINGHGCLAHRVIWIMVHGYEPKQIDHIDGDRQNNRLQNLREVIAQQNSQNQKRKVDNSSGTTGVSFNSRRRKWHAYININHQRTNLGWFETYNDAVTIRKIAEKHHGFHPNHGR